MGHRGRTLIAVAAGAAVVTTAAGPALLGSGPAGDGRPADSLARLLTAAAAALPAFGDCEELRQW